MKSLYHSLLLLIAGSTQKELASQFHYLKIENRRNRVTLFVRQEANTAYRRLTPTTARSVEEISIVMASNCS